MSAKFLFWERKKKSEKLEERRAEIQADLERTRKFQRKRAKLKLLRTRTPERQLFICLRAARMKQRYGSEILGKAFVLETDERGNLVSYFWKSVFWGTITAFRIEYTDYKCELILTLSSPLFRNGEQDITFDKGDREKGWSAMYVDRREVTGLRLAIVD